MNVLLLGARGLTGTRLAQVLRQAGHTVFGAGRGRSTDGSAWRSLDFATLTTAEAWLPHLAGMDAVVNCVGIFRERGRGDFDLLQRAAPLALFAACERVGMARLIQVSALGSAPGAGTPYWRSKGAADAALLASGLNASVVRPSLVFGTDGASSRLFMTLATLPLLALPLAHSAKVQPIHVDDLARALLALLETAGPMPRELAAVGPRALTLAAYLGALRDGMGAAPAWVCALPLALARPLARLAVLHPASPLTPAALTMLADDNTADPAPLRALLGRPLRDPASFAGPHLRAEAALAWGLPLLRISIAALWLITALVSWFGWPHADSGAWLAACGVPPAWREALLLGASLLDGAIAAALLLRPRRWLWPAQLLLVAGYTAIMSLCLPEFWLHPFGPLTKNLPIAAIMLLMWRITPNRS